MKLSAGHWGAAIVVALALGLFCSPLDRPIETPTSDTCTIWHRNAARLDGMGRDPGYPPPGC